MTVINNIEDYENHRKEQNETMNKKNNKLQDQNTEPTFEQLMEKFQFHNNAIKHHAHIAQFIADSIRENFPEEAKNTGYFTEKFFEENKAKAEPGDASPGGVSQTSVSASELK